MMLAHPQMDAVLDFDVYHVRTLVIENPPFFRKLLEDVDAQIRGFSGETVLSERDEPIPFSGNAELIDSFLSFDICRKSLMTKLTARMEAAAMDETHYLRTSELVGNLEQYIQELSLDLPCDVYCAKMNFGTILRAVGIGIPEDYSDGLERLLDYMELSRELEKEKLYIFVNLRSYYSDEEVQAFFDSVLAHEYRILLVDSVSREKLKNEIRVTIDDDLCEF